MKKTDCTHENCTCGQKRVVPNTDSTYMVYSKVLNKPFDTVEELKAAEEKHFAEIKAKEDKAAAKKSDAIKVEDAFKALNAARREYKTKLADLTKVYSEGLVSLKTKFEESRKIVQDTLAAAETAYAKALKEFTDKHETYHLSLKDGDFETTISSSQSKSAGKKELNNIADLFDFFFRF